METSIAAKEMQTSRCGRGALTLLYDFCSSAQKSLLRRKTGAGGFILLYDEGTVISDFTPDNIAIQLFNATATALNCISQICCFHVALISCLAIIRVYHIFVSISTCALREEGNRLYNVLCGLLGQFLSTPSARRATLYY